MKTQDEDRAKLKTFILLSSFNVFLINIKGIVLMVLFGVLFNCICIITGSIIGFFFNKIPENLKKSMMNGIGLIVVYIGIDMAFSTESLIIVMLSIVSGIALGELFDIESFFIQIGNWINEKFKSSKNDQSIVDGFIFSTVFFVVGAMSILGALESGIHGDHNLLIVKGIMDGFISLIFTATMGFGVIISVIPLFVFQALIVILATKINYFIPNSLLNEFVSEITGVGGVLILGIGLNILEVTKIKISNFLPSVITVFIIFSLSKLSVII